MLTGRLALPRYFETSVEVLKKQVRLLSHDDAFGMLTRPALLNHTQALPNGTYYVIFIDLDGIHELNSQVGYEEVNRRVRNSFVPVFRHTDLVGRWYSGDEILILLPCDSETAIGLVKRLHREAAANRLSFTHALGTWPHPHEALEDVVAQLLRQVAMRKEAKRRE